MISSGLRSKIRLLTLVDCEVRLLSALAQFLSSGCVVLLEGLALFEVLLAHRLQLLLLLLAHFGKALFSSEFFHANFLKFYFQGYTWNKI